MMVPVVAGQPLGEQRAHRLGDRRRVLHVPADRRALIPALLEQLYLGAGLLAERAADDRAHRQRPDRPGGNEIRTHAVLAGLARHEPVDRLQRALGDRHPVVGRHRPARVEVHADDGTAGVHDRQQRLGQRGIRVRGDVDALGDVLVGRVEERVDAHPGLRHEADRMHHAVELVALTDHVGHPVRQSLQVLLVLHVEFDQRGLLRQPVGDALDQPQPVESGQHQFGALLLGHPGDVKRDRRVGDDPGDQDPFAFEQSCHVRPCVSGSLSGPCPCRRRPGSPHRRCMLASSDARKLTTPATSSAVPTRPAGIACCAISWTPLVHGAGHLGVDVAGGHHVRGDPGLATARGSSSGPSRPARPSRPRSWPVPHAGQPDHRSHEDQPAEPLLLMLRDARWATRKAPVRLASMTFSNCSSLIRMRKHVRGDAGVGHQHLDRTLLLLDRL